jgi:hypothetical protein
VALAARTEARQMRGVFGGIVTRFASQVGIAVVVSLLTLTAATASAQELSLGYQWQQLSFDIEDEFDVFRDDSITAPLGFNIDVAGPISSSLDLFGQFDWSRQSNDVDLFGESVESSWNFMTFGGGIRWSGRSNPGVTPFVQGLFGVMRTSFGCEVVGFDCDDFVDDDDLSRTDPMFQFGGGVAIPMGGLSFLGQADYRHTFLENASINGFRFVLGVRIGG